MRPLLPTAYPRWGSDGSKATPMRLPSKPMGAAGSRSHKPLSFRHCHIAPVSPTAWARSPSGQATPRAQALVTALQDAGFDATLSSQIQKDIWYKLWGNMTVNPVSALTGATTDQIMDDPLVRGFISQVMLEAREIGARLGIPITQEPEDRHAVTRKLGAFRTSMLQDVQARRPVELDALVTVVQEIGRLTQVPTPCTDALLGLARLQAQTLGLYPMVAR